MLVARGRPKARPTSAVANGEWAWASIGHSPTIAQDAVPLMALSYSSAGHPPVSIFFYARFHCRTLRGRGVMGLGYGPHIGRGRCPFSSHIFSP